MNSPSLNPEPILQELGFGFNFGFDPCDPLSGFNRNFGIYAAATECMIDHFRAVEEKYGTEKTVLHIHSLICSRELRNSYPDTVSKGAQAIATLLNKNRSAFDYSPRIRLGFALDALSDPPFPHHTTDQRELALHTASEVIPALCSHDGIESVLPYIREFLCVCGNRSEAGIAMRRFMAINLYETLRTDGAEVAVQCALAIGPDRPPVQAFTNDHLPTIFNDCSSKRGFGILVAALGNDDLTTELIRNKLIPFHHSVALKAVTTARATHPALT